MFGFGLLYLFLAVGLAVHAMRTGRSQWWLFILFFPTWTIFPWAGSLAYVVIELIPAMFRTRGARMVRSGIGAIIDPDKELRERVAQAELVDFGGREAGTCRRVREAEPMAGSDPALPGPRRRAFSRTIRPCCWGSPARSSAAAMQPACLETLHKLDEVQHNLRNQEAHLMLARALEATGRTDEALEEYDAVSRYYAGFEARSRYALLLLKQGRAEQARDLFQEVVRASSARRVGGHACRQRVDQDRENQPALGSLTGAGKRRSSITAASFAITPH